MLGINCVSENLSVFQLDITQYLLYCSYNQLPIKCESNLTSHLFSHYDYPQHYMDCFTKNYNALDPHGSPLSVELINLLVNTCHVSLNHFVLSSFHFNKIVSSTELQLLLPKLLKSVHFITFLYCCEVKHLEPVLEFIFKCCESIKSVLIKDCVCITRYYKQLKSVSSYCYPLLPYLKSPSLNGLKELTVSGMRMQYTAVKQLISILNYQVDLENLSLNLPVNNHWPDTFSEFHDSLHLLTQCMADLFDRPLFKRLSINMKLMIWQFYGCALPAHAVHIEYPKCDDMVVTLFRKFFSSPYPVSLSLNVFCQSFDALPESLPFNYDQPSKCLELKSTLVSQNFSSILPAHLVLKSFVIDDCGKVQGNQAMTILRSFTNQVKSLNVESITVHVDYDSTNDLLSLINIVTTQERNIFIEPGFLDILTITTALSSTRSTHLRSFGVKSTASAHIFEAVFQSLSHTNSPYFELYLTAGSFCHDEQVYNRPKKYIQLGKGVEQSH